MKVYSRLLVALLVVGLFVVGGIAKDIPVPAGDPILTITGAIALTNSDGAFAFDEAMLRALPAIEYFVVDPWMGDNTYGGVLLSTVLEYVGFPLGAEKVVLVASDAKEFEIKIADLLVYPIILVLDVDGDALIESLGGPVKVAYPYSAYPAIEDVYPPENWAWYVIEVRVEY